MQADVERSGPGAALYVGMIVLVLALTLLEIVAVGLPAIGKPLILVLLATNFTFSALYSMGLQFEGPVAKATFGVGVALALVVALSVPVLMALGYTPVRGG